MPLPPPPINDVESTFAFKEWLNKIYTYVSAGVGSIPWSSVSKSGSSLADLAVKSHSSLDAVPGSSDSYHVTSEYYDSVVQYSTGGSPGYSWKDMLSPIAGAKLPPATAPTWTAFGPSGNRLELAFAVNDYAIINPFHTNHDVLVGGKMYLHIHWTTNGTNTNTVKWQFEVMRAKGHNQQAFGTPATYTVEQAASGTAWQHMVTEVSDGDALTITEPDELILVVLKRITNGGTDNADTVFGLMVDLHYQADRDGTLNKAPNFYS